MSVSTARISDLWMRFEIIILRRGRELIGPEFVVQVAAIQLFPSAEQRLVS